MQAEMEISRLTRSGNSDAAATDYNLISDPSPYHTIVSYLHAAHTGAHARMEFIDTHVIQEKELGTHHVKYSENGESGRVTLAIRRVDRARTSRAIAAADDIGADDEELVGINVESRPNELFPPARLGVLWVRLGVRRGRQAGMNKNRIVLLLVERAPRLVGDVQFGKHAAMVEQERLRIFKRLVAGHNAVVARLRPVVQLCCARVEFIHTRKRHGWV